MLEENVKKSDIINKYLCTTGGISLQLRRIKFDLEFEPDTIYNVSGDILCNIVNRLNEVE